MEVWNTAKTLWQATNEVCHTAFAVCHTAFAVCHTAFAVCYRPSLCATPYTAFSVYHTFTLHSLCATTTSLCATLPSLCATLHAIGQVVDCFLARIQMSDNVPNDQWGDIFFVRPFFYGFLLQDDVESPWEFYVKKAFEGPKNRIIFPICTNKHWILLVLNRIREEAVYLSSLKDEIYEEAAMKVFEWIDSRIPKENILKIFKFTVGECPIQKNCYDCGVFMMHNISATVNEIRYRESIIPDDVPQFRVKLAIHFWTEGLEQRKAGNERYADEVDIGSEVPRSRIFSKPRPKTKKARSKPKK